MNYFLYRSIEFTGKEAIDGGARLGYRTEGGIEISAFVRNITNKIRRTNGIDYDNLTGVINEPRIFGGRVRASF